MGVKVTPLQSSKMADRPRRIGVDVVISKSKITDYSRNMFNGLSKAA